MPSGPPPSMFMPTLGEHSLPEKKNQPKLCGGKLWCQMAHRFPQNHRINRRLADAASQNLPSTRNTPPTPGTGPPPPPWTRGTASPPTGHHRGPGTAAPWTAGSCPAPRAARRRFCGAARTVSGTDTVRPLSWQIMRIFIQFRSGTHRRAFLDICFGKKISTETSCMYFPQGGMSAYV